MPTMDSYQAQTTPNNSDYHIVNDGVSGETKKITRDDYLQGAPLPNNTVTTPAIANSSVTASKLATGATSAYVATAGSLNTAGYTDLASTADSVTVTIGANGLALVSISSYMLCTQATAVAYTSFEMSGANTLVAGDKYSIWFQAFANNAFDNKGASFILTGLNPGSTTFKMKYKASGNFATWELRHIGVIPL